MGRIFPVKVTIKKLDAFLESKKLLTSFRESNSIVSGDNEDDKIPDTK